MSLEELRAKLQRYVETKATVWDFNGDRVDAQQASVIADALKADATVVELKLQVNDMGPEGAKAVAEALRHNATLHTVDLSWNRMGPEGAKAVAEALRYNTTLHTVDLSSNLIDDTIRKDIEELLERNRRLAEHSNDKSQKPAADSNQVLLEAAQAGLLDAVQYAVEAGASLDATTAEGQTALQLAAQHGHTAVVHFLAAQGPEGPRQLAATFWQEVAAGHADLVEYLLGAGGFDVDQHMPLLQPRLLTATLSHPSCRLQLPALARAMPICPTCS